jgi:hypothetical protein
VSRREPDSPYLRIEVEAEVPGANTVQRAEADAMAADLQDAMTDAIEAAAEEVLSAIPTNARRD